MKLGELIDYGLGVFHCSRCHKVVRTYDARTPDEAAAILLGHLSFNCVDNVLAALREPPR